MHDRLCPAAAELPTVRLLLSYFATLPLTRLAVDSSDQEAARWVAPCRSLAQAGPGGADPEKRAMPALQVYAARPRRGLEPE
jgi:hypothetical protein